jgi:hypothetical protein
VPLDSSACATSRLGYLTRDFVYRNRGLTPPATPLTSS